jgi:endonuclease-3
MRKKERYEKVIAWFQDNVPVAETELHYNNPYELLIAVILSAQCTDKRVNIITPPLYKDFPTPEALAATTPEVIFEYIRSVSYPNNKAKHLVGMAKMLVNDFNSEVPDNLEDLIKLPGVGRKTANVIQSVVFKKAAMAVDTHVFRVSHRRTGAGQLHHPVQRGKRTGEEYSGKAHTDCPSLAHPARPLRLSGTYSQM